MQPVQFSFYFAVVATCSHRLFFFFFFADGFETSQLRYRSIHVHMLNEAYEMSDFVIINQSATIDTKKYFLGMNSFTSSSFGEQVSEKCSNVKSAVHQTARDRALKKLSLESASFHIEFES